MMRIGVDVGGTFTDVVLETSGELFSTKILTTYDAPEEGVLAGASQEARCRVLFFVPVHPLRE